MYEWLNCFELKDGQVSERIMVWIVGFDRPGALRLIQHNTGHMPLWVGSSIAFNTWRRSSLLFGVVKLDRTYVRLFRTCHHPYNICLHAIAVLCNPQFLWGICCDLWGNLATVLGSLAYCIVCQRSPRLVLLVQREREISCQFEDAQHWHCLSNCVSWGESGDLVWAVDANAAAAGHGLRNPAEGWATW